MKTSTMFMIAAVVVLAAAVMMIPASATVRAQTSGGGASGDAPEHTFGKNIISNDAQTAQAYGDPGNYGAGTAGYAQSNGGLQIYKAPGCGENEFPTLQGGHDVC